MEGKGEGGRRKERKEERNGKGNKGKERSDMAQENKTDCIENRLLVDSQQYCLFLTFRKKVVGFYLQPDSRDMS